MSEVRAYAKDGFEYGNDSEAVLIFKALGNNADELSEDDLKSGVVTIHDNLLNDPEATIAAVDQGAIVNLRAAIVKNIELAKAGEGINPDYCLAGYGIRQDEAREDNEAGAGENDGNTEATVNEAGNEGANTEATVDGANTETETKADGENTAAGEGAPAGDNTPAGTDGEAAAGDNQVATAGEGDGAAAV